MAEIDSNCLSCGLYKKGCKTSNMDPYGATSDVELYIVGESPSITDDEQGKPFSGKGGGLVKDALRDLRVDMKRVRYYNAINCNLKGSLDTVAYLKACGHRVREDINRTRPKSIVVLGSDAMRALFPDAYPQVYTIQRSRGCVVPYVLGDGTVIPAVCTLDQNQLIGIRDPSMQQAWFDDIGKAVDYAKFKFDVNLKYNIIQCKTFDLVKECFTRLLSEPIVAFDFETTALKPFAHPGTTAELYSVAFAFDNGDTYAIPLYNYWPTNIGIAIIESIGKWLVEARPDQIKIGHNTKFDILWGLVKAAALYKKLPPLDLMPVGKYEDTSLMCWILDERPGMSKLKVAGFKFFGVPNWSVDVTDVRKLPLEDVLVYNAKDSFYTLRLYQFLRPKIAASASYDHLYTELMLPASMQFIKIEMRGVPVDMEELTKLYREYETKIIAMRQAICKEVGRHDFNPGSLPQLQKYFVEECKYKMPRKTATGFSTDDEALEFLVKTYNDGAAKLIMEWRGATKLQSTYIAGMQKHIFDDGRLRGSFNMVATVTGRTSSSDPNMQNFPKRTNKEIRRIVRAPEGYKLVSFDYGQIEARLFGVVTADPDFCEILTKNYDIHLENSRFLFGDELAKKFRGPVKNGTFAMLYGAGDPKIAETTGAPVEKVAQLRQLVFGRFKRFKPWQSEITHFEQQNGYVESLFGRRRRSPMSSTELLNHTTQSTASDMTLSAMNVLGRRYEVAFMVHDDLSFFLPDDNDLDSKIEHIANVMLTVPWLHLSRSPWRKAYVPLQVECSVGNNWCDQEEILKVDSIQMGYHDQQDCIDNGLKLVEDLKRRGW